MKNKILLFIIIASILGGGIGVFGKIALQEIPSFSFTFIRFAFAFCFLLPILVKNGLTINKSIYKAVLISLLATANVVLFAFGIKYTEASIAQMIYTASPLLTVILSYIFLKSTCSKTKILGLLIGFIGTSIIVMIPLFRNNFNVTSEVGGTLLILLAMISYTSYSIFSKQLSDTFTPIQLTSIFAFTTLLITGAFSVSDVYNFPSWWEKLSPASILSVGYVGVLGTAGYYLIIQMVIKKASPIYSNLILYLQPATTIILSIILLNESLTFPFVIGSILSFIGVWIVTNNITKKSK